jgi:hypothetical protein
MESSHAYFDRLCVMAAVNEISPAENERLAEHARTCEVCRQAIEQYQQIAAQMYTEASRETDARAEAGATFGNAGEEQERAKEALLAQVNGTIRPPLSDGEARKVRRRGTVLAEASSRISAWAGWAVAAILLVGLTGVSAQYLMTKRQSREVDARTTSLQKEIEELRRELSSVHASTRNAGTNAGAAQEPLDAKRLQAANE